MKIAFFSTKSYDRYFFERYNASFNHTLCFYEAQLNPDTAPLAEGFDAVCVFVNDQLTRATLSILSRKGVRLVALRCAGFNNIDLAAARETGIRVVRVPAYSPHAIAEHAVALALTLNRKTHKAYNRVRENNFSLEKLIGFDLWQKTVGVIGTGQIGAAFCAIMLGFGCRVIAYDSFPSPKLADRGVEYTSLDTLFQRSDILSLHCPLTPDTRHLINKESFSRMKKGVMLINTSRGAVIDTKDAIDALKTGQLGYLGMDVYEQEENLFFRDLSESIIEDDIIARLMSFPNVLVTAHQGFFTNEAFEQIATITLQNISTVEKGADCGNEVPYQPNPSL
ncbi:2-hydroxyacid dehydrogenase [Sediminibacterium soli]|uniref:2-hydroxyacid dehydrogenase n=1 Tax=Sediminibacterium soli TaxID=2698829 RepID=UPI0013793C77|nr:2-hydroxyacid dehydrogenase [Sediminibacterium soli]NCI45523.1 2-hydroxyacid dehydrogenase [Sediminibacterium soli]